MTHLAGAIILGLDSAIGLTIMRELGQHGVPVHGVGRSTSGVAAASRYCTTAFERPDGPIAAWLPDLIARTGAGALFATSETDLLELAGLPPRIGDCHLLVPRMEPLQKVLDKNRTLAAAAEAGLRVPHSWQPVAGEDFAERIAALRYPVVAKWAHPPEAMRRLGAHGLEWIKADYVRSAGELARLLGRYRPVGCWPLIQEYCGGWGLGQMLHMADGRATLRFQHRRLHEWPPEGGVSTLCRAEPPERHAAQMALSEKLLRALDWQGPAMVEYRHDGTHYWLMEVNGRFWGSLPLAWHCGAHFAWEGYRRAVLGERDSGQAASPYRGLRARYMVPETKRLARLLLAPRRIGDPFFRVHRVREAAGYILAFFDPRTRYYILTLSDPRPWMRDMAQIFRKAVRREKC